MIKRSPEGPPIESVYAAIAAERLQSRLQRGLIQGRLSQAEVDAARAALRPGLPSGEKGTTPEPARDAPESDFGRASSKRIRVRDALLQVAAEGEVVSVDGVAARLGVSGLLVKRMLREHQIRLPQPVKVEPAHLGSIEARGESVRTELLRLHSEGQLTSIRRASEILGVSPPTVRRAMRQQGIGRNVAPKRVRAEPEKARRSRGAARIDCARRAKRQKCRRCGDSGRGRRREEQRTVRNTARVLLNFCCSVQGRIWCGQGVDASGVSGS